MRPYLAIAAAVLFVQAGVLRAPLVLDDKTIIVENACFHPAVSLSCAASRPYLVSYFRPLTQISMGFDRILWGDDTRGYHATNLVLHVANALLVFSLLRCLTLSPGYAFLAALLFGLHPINSTAVSYVSDRGNVLSAFFILAAGRAFFSPGNGLPLLAAGLCSLAAALGARENGLLAPLFLLALVPVLPPEVRRGLWKNKFLLAGFWAVAAALFLVLRSAVAGDPLFLSWEPRMAPSWDNIVNFLRLTGWTASRLVIPPDNGLFHPLAGVSKAWALAGAVLWLAPLAVGRRDRQATAGLLLFLAGSLPSYWVMFRRADMGLVYQYNQFYIASIGGCLVLAQGIALIRSRRAALAVFGLLVGLMSWRTAANHALWADPEAYAQSWLARDPNNHLAWNFLADTEKDKGRFAEAFICYQKGLRGTPKDHVSYTNMGKILLLWGRPWDAALAFEKAIAVSPDAWRAANDLGVLLWKQGDREAALSVFDRALKTGRNPGSALFKNAIGLCIEMDRPGEALAWIDAFERRFQRDPEMLILKIKLLIRGGRAAAALDTLLSILPPGTAQDPALRQELLALFRERGWDALVLELEKRKN